MRLTKADFDRLPAKSAKFQGLDSWCKVCKETVNCEIEFLNRAQKKIYISFFYLTEVLVLLSIKELKSKNQSEQNIHYVLESF